MAFFRRTREIQLFCDREEIADLMHFHGRPQRSREGAGRKLWRDPSPVLSKGDRPRVHGADRFFHLLAIFMAAGE
jgi:hypothetical protein